MPRKAIGDAERKRELIRRIQEEGAIPRVLDELSLATYEGPHIDAETRVVLVRALNEVPPEQLEQMSLSELQEFVAQVRQQVAVHRGSLRSWLEAIRQVDRKWVVFWGAAADAAVTRPMAELVQKVVRLLVMKGAALCHGSSVTGYMGVCDSSAAKTFHEMGSRECMIATIPLRWFAQRGETPAKNGSKRLRCPPHVDLSDRTKLFSLINRVLIVAAPGGFGTRKELIDELLEEQLKDGLLTSYTEKRELPRIVLLDGWIEEANAWSYSPWAWDLDLQVDGKAIKRENLSRIEILRIQREAKDCYKPKYVRVRYFKDEDELVTYVGEAFSS